MLSLAGNIQQRGVSCATFGLRLLPQLCCSSGAYILLMLEPKAWSNRHRVMHHRRTVLGCLPAMAHLPTTGRHHPVVNRRRTLMGRHWVMAHQLSSVGDHPVTGRHLPMAARPSTVCHHARTSYHRTLMGRPLVIAHNPRTVSCRTTVRRRAGMSYRRAQFRELAE